MTFRKILCPTDFSEGSHRAMEMAVRLAGESGAQLELVHAWFVPAALYEPEVILHGEVIQQIADDAQRALDAAVIEAKRLGAATVTARLLNGLPWRMIIDTADDPAFDLIVVGTHGRTGLARVLLGSVAEKIVRHAPCSVMAVRPDATIGPFSHVLSATDFTESSRYAMQLAGALVKRGGKGIELLHVLEVPTTYRVESHPPDIYRELDRTATQLLEKCARGLALELDLPVEGVRRIGRPGAEILEAIDHDRTLDLVTVGSHGRTGLKRMVLGSVAEKVVRHSRCPVLVARRRA